MAEIKIQLDSWDRFNPRKDVKNPSWFRMENSLFENAKFFDFSLQEKAVFLYILSMASKVNSSKVTIFTEHAQKIGGIPEDLLLSTIEKLKKNETLNEPRYAHVTHTLRGRDAHVTSAGYTDGQTDKQTDAQGSSSLTPIDVDSPKKKEERKELEKRHGISEELVEGWVELYDNEAWVKNELRLAADWLSRNPAKLSKLKSPPKFFSNWLRRSAEEQPTKKFTKKPAPQPPPDSIPGYIDPWEHPEEYDGGIRS